MTTAEISIAGTDLPALVDTSDLHLVTGHTWRALRGHAGKVYAYASMNGVIVYMHRLIAGTPAGKETDHINGNGLDNRRANLRVATASQNSANTRKPRIGRPHSSRYKGGRFNAEDEAARAYDSAAVAAWGEFARTNFEQTGANNG